MFGKNEQQQYKFFKEYYYYYIENYEKFLSEYNATIEGKINTMEYTKENILNDFPCISNPNWH